MIVFSAPLLTVVLSCGKLALVKASPGDLKGTICVPCAGDAFTILLFSCVSREGFYFVTCLHKQLQTLFEANSSKRLKLMTPSLIDNILKNKYY